MVDRTPLAHLSQNGGQTDRDLASRLSSNLYLLDLFNGEMLNGGVHQFFANTSGDLAQEVVVALREANLPKHADAVQKGVEMFASPYPVDRQIRGRYFFVNGETTGVGQQARCAYRRKVDDGAIGAAMLADRRARRPVAEMRSRRSSRPGEVEGSP